MWAGVAVMGVLFVHNALRGPKNHAAPAQIALGRCVKE
jgi:hypothetical protein